VNVASLSEEEYAEVSPYIEMAARLGQLLGHEAGAGVAGDGLGSVESISLTYNGRLAQLKTELIRNAAIEGVLHGADGINRINATAAATERGIRVVEDKREHIAGGTGSTLRLSLHWVRKDDATEGHQAGPGRQSQPHQGDWTGLATVIHGSSPRLLSYDGIDIEAELAGALVIIRNQDVPGVIGRIGTILGEARLNIANFALGRSRGGRVREGHALAVVQLDVAPGDESALAEATAELKKVDAITSVRVVELPKL
jgi:D-3-phosphoglycerate dehydrogenase